ncbi:hypothetical protein QAD02_021662 [Eretmocerus hayati]|uniref:Uncharacterized protein n=1 Tax=Eretmocerus hayati TaxID=131215 RepID=A0ACC2PQJ2_9HYME|nr:hypothetical protein QAD02_021662 [Eretmocerus hayati]
MNDSVEHNEGPQQPNGAMSNVAFLLGSNATLESTGTHKNVLITQSKISTSSSSTSHELSRVSQPSISPSEECSVVLPCTRSTGHNSVPQSTSGATGAPISNRPKNKAFLLNDEGYRQRLIEAQLRAQEKDSK